MTKKKPSKEDELKKQVEELTDTLQRLQAEFENFKKRCDKETTDFKKYAEAEMINDMLPIVDAFDIAMKNHKGDNDFSEGINLIHKQMHAFLKGKGLIPIDCVGKKFDPYHHEVLLSADSKEDDGIVLEELQKGYMFHDKVLRHSKVKVSKKTGGKK